MSAEHSETGERALTRKGQATRDRIVAAASQLVFERGVASTSVDDVQKAAGVSASQLYHYFDDRQMLIRAVIAHQIRAVLDNQQPWLGRLDSIEALRAWRDLLVGIQRNMNCQGGCPLGTLAGELSESWPDFRMDLSAGFDLWETAIRQGLRAMHDRGDLRRDVDPDRLATATLAAVEGGLLLTQVHRRTAPLEAALDEMIDHIAALQPKRRQAR